MVSVPTSIRPIDFGSMLNFSRSPQTAEGRSQYLHDGEGNVHTIQSEGVDVFAVVWPSHIFLPETNGVFALGDTVENLEVSLGHALRG
jgi:hypothetical protein